MIMYLGVANKSEFDLVTCFDKASVLASYHFFRDKAGIDFLIANKKKPKNLFIDSGAFSAHHSGKLVRVDDYSKFLKKLEPKEYAGLDVIDNPVKSMENQKWMEEKYGLKPIPTYHLLDNDFSFLKRMVEEYDHIAIGGAVGVSRAVAEQVYDICWGVILGAEKEIKVHGFGMTNIYMMDKYPWYSVDSNSFKSVVIHGDFRFYSRKDFRKGTSIYIDDYLREKFGEEILKDKGKCRELAIKIQLEEFLKIEEYINENHKKKDFSYLKRKLFI